MTLLYNPEKQPTRLGITGRNRFYWPLNIPGQWSEKLITMSLWFY